MFSVLYMYATQPAAVRQDMERVEEGEWRCLMLQRMVAADFSQGD